MLDDTNQAKIWAKELLKCIKTSEIIDPHFFDGFGKEELKELKEGLKALAEMKTPDERN